MFFVSSLHRILIVPLTAETSAQQNPSRGGARRETHGLYQDLDELRTPVNGVHGMRTRRSMRRLIKSYSSELTTVAHYDLH